MIKNKKSERIVGIVEFVDQQRPRPVLVHVVGFYIVFGFFEELIEEFPLVKCYFFGSLLYKNTPFLNYFGVTLFK